MNINRYLKKKSPLPILALVFPGIPVAIALIQAVNMLYQGLSGYLTKILLLVISMFFTLMITLPVCGGAGMLCSILALRKLGRTKRITGAIVWNGLTLVLGIVLVFLYFL